MLYQISSLRHFTQAVRFAGLFLLMAMTLGSVSALAAERNDADLKSTLPAKGAEQWTVFEFSFTSDRKYDNSFLDVQVDVVFRSGDQQWLVPAFWAEDDKWTVRFAPPVQGDYTFQVTCSDPANQMMNGAAQRLHVTGERRVGAERLPTFYQPGN